MQEHFSEWIFRYLDQLYPIISLILFWTYSFLIGGKIRIYSLADLLTALSQQYRYIQYDFDLHLQIYNRYYLLFFFNKNFRITGLEF